MSYSCFLRPHQDLYSICIKQLLPIASERVQSVDIDYWDLDDFLGLAFHILLSETDPKLQFQVAQLIPLFGAKAVPTLMVIEQQPTLDVELRSLANWSISQIGPKQQVTGMIDVLRAYEDKSLDSLVAQKLWKIRSVATDVLATLLTDPDNQGIALRLLTQFQQFEHHQVARLEALYRQSPDLDHSAPKNTILQRVETLLSAAVKAESLDPRQAVTLYTEVLQLCPDQAQAYGDRGLLRATLGDPQGAMADLQSAADLFRQQGKTANVEIAVGYCKAIARRLSHLD